MKIVFRCDASVQIGTGHVMRCLTLAKALAERGGKCDFICRKHKGHLLEVIKQQGHQVHELPLEYESESQIKNEAELAHAAWLGTTQDNDAALSMSILQEQKLDWLIVDHYALDIKWEEKLRPYCKNLMVIDDLADRQHDCDILLDQNYLPNYENRYNFLSSGNTTTLLGPSYVLLRKEFRKIHILNENTDINIKNPKVLINFGGIGNHSFLLKVIKAIDYNDFFEFIVITGNLKDSEFSELNSMIRNPRISILRSSNNMAALMSESAYALGACGSTVWERFCLGLNSALVEMADNQHPLLKYLNEQELIDSLGDYNYLSVTFLTEFFNKLDLNSEQYFARRIKIMKLVDGMGTQRVAEKILEVTND